MAHWRKFEDAIRYYQVEGFRVGKARCRTCGFKWICNIFPETPEDKMECPCCHNCFSTFAEFPPVTQSEKLRDRRENNQ